MENDCPEYMGVMPIRLLNVKTTNPEMFERINLLMDHNDTMAEDEVSVWQSQVVDPILKSGQNSWTKEDIFRAIGIINTNGVSQGLVHGHGLYPTFSYLSHRSGKNSRHHYLCTIFFQNTFHVIAYISCNCLNFM
jgi:hypothetical protein